MIDDDVILYRRWLRGKTSERPPYVERHFIARFLNIPVWDLDKVPLKYIQEAQVILRARFEERLEIARSAKCSASDVVLPDF